MPLGCTIRYEHTTISAVAISSFLRWNVAGSNPLITPLSKMYSRTDFGGLGRVCERAKGASAANASTAWRVVARSLRENMAPSIPEQRVDRESITAHPDSPRLRCLPQQPVSAHPSGPSGVRRLTLQVHLYQRSEIGPVVAPNLV